jgi:nucleoside-diphosphate-sugar epimerase
MRPLFLTGASGFVGRHLAAELARLGVPDVRLLLRGEPAGLLPGPLPPGWRVVAGDLRDPARWTAALSGVHTVAHLAALTGKASRREHERINREGTRTLVEAARAAGVSRFLFVSTIAAGYADRRHYHYANAKAAAEAVVRASGMEALVVRPTMVLGPGSPVLANLRRLATLPVPIMFGRGLAVQPIHVADLAAQLAAALERERWPAEPAELGGPEAVPMARLLGAIREAAGQPARGAWRVPLQPTRSLLALVEPVLLGVLPFTAGQLAAFANPATAAPSDFAAGLPPPRYGLSEMVGGRSSDAG